jgi:hypothetical protein
MKTKLMKLNKADSSTIREAYNVNVKSAVDFANTITAVWNRNLGSCILDVASGILADIFQGVKDGSLYLAPGKTGIAWKLLRESFVGLKVQGGTFEPKDFTTACGLAWKSVHGTKFNTGLIQDQAKKKAKAKASGSEPNITVSGVEWEIKFLLKHGKKSEVKKMLVSILASL